MILSYYYIRKAIRKLVESKKELPRCFCSLQNASRLLVVGMEKDWDAITPCIDSLRQQGKEVLLCIYAERTSARFEDNTVLGISGKTDLNRWGFPSPALEEQWAAWNVDIVIDLTCGQVPALQYLLLTQSSAFKVGVKTSDIDVYDFALMATDFSDKHYLLSQILFYLQTIRFE